MFEATLRRRRGGLALRFGGTTLARTGMEEKMLCVFDRSLKSCAILVAVSMLALGPAKAGEADVVDVKVSKQGTTFSFDVTVKHADTGWKHYANKWEVVAPDGKVLGKRVLFHPHVEEQPFTRSLSNVRIPAEVKQVVVRAGDSKHELGGKEMTVDVPH